MSDKYIQLSTGIQPRNNNPRVWIVEQENVKGGVHQYASLEDFVALHPNVMTQNMEATVGQHQRGSSVFPLTKFTLDAVPEEADYPLSLDEADANYFGKFWRKTQELEVKQIATVYQYAPDINGLKPIYPYTSAQESSWVDTYDPSANHKWLRFRNTSRDEDADGIFDDWSIPRPINGNFESGDYVQNLFQRTTTKPDLPPTTLNGIPNNEPSGWSDTPPAGTALLWEIKAQKDVYGNLKSDWLGPYLIPEDEDLVRYNSRSTPNPVSLVDNTTPATDPSQANTDLNNAGWVKTFDPATHQYRALRIKNGTNDYTDWELVKIADESGEYTEFIYKLFPINTDFDSVSFISTNTPTIDNPIEGTSAPNLGWSDIQQTENTTEVNFVSSARKFFDGTLKTPWSSPRPFTGFDSYSDSIKSGGQNNFKYTSSEDTTPSPATITLEYSVFKGITEITSGITYKWYKVFNNDVASEPTTDGDGFPTSTPIATTKTLEVSPADVTGKAIYRCYAIIAVDGGNDLLFSDNEPIVDITDGDDAKSLVISAENQAFIYNTNTSVFNDPIVTIRYFQSFLDGIPIYWFRWNGSAWARVNNGDASPVGAETYAIAGNELNINTVGLFASDTSAQTQRFAVSTDDTDPVAVDAFYDIITIGKTGIANGAGGANGTDGTSPPLVLLSNEVDNIVLDQITGDPQTGEIAKTKTKISGFIGAVKQTPNSGFTIDTIESDNVNVTFTAESVVGTDFEIGVATWGSTETSAICTITMTIGTETVIKTFKVTASFDNAGATIADIDLAASSPNKTFTFTPLNRGNDIYLEAKLYQNGIPVSSANFDSDVVWKFNGTNVDSLPPYASRYTSEVANKDIIRVTRNDAINVINVSATIRYGGKTFTAVGVTIDDVLDNQSFYIYNNYTAVPADLNTIPTVLSDQPYANIPATGSSNTPNAGGGWYRTPQSNSFWTSIGTELSNGNVTFGPAFRVRGEEGVQGPSSDFILTLYRLNNDTAPSPNNKSVEDMINVDGWSKVPQAVSNNSDILYQAVANFDGSKVGDDSQQPDGIWYISQVNGLVGAPGTPGTPGTDGTNGTDGLGWTGGSYNGATGIVTFASDDGLGFATGDLRGADGNDALPDLTRGGSSFGETQGTATSAEVSRTIFSISNSDKMFVMLDASIELAQGSTTRLRLEIQANINSGGWNAVKTHYKTLTSHLQDYSISYKGLKQSADTLIQYRLVATALGGTLTYKSGSNEAGGGAPQVINPIEHSYAYFKVQ